jgi:hypothetical protein
MCGGTVIASWRKWLTITVITMLVLLLAWAGFKVVDLAAELDDARTQQSALQRDLLMLARLATEQYAAVDRVSMVQALQARHPGHVKDEDAQRVSVDGIVFVFTGDRLAAIEPMSLPNVPPPPAGR